MYDTHSRYRGKGGRSKLPPRIVTGLHRNAVGCGGDLDGKSMLLFTMYCYAPCISDWKYVSQGTVMHHT